MTKSESKKLKEERIRLFRDAAGFKKTARIPYFSSAVTWKVFDAGKSLIEAETDHSVMEAAVRHFLDTYPVDGMLDTGIRNQFDVMKAFGSDGYYYVTEDSIGIRDHAYCTPETLMDYVKDPLRYTWEKILPEKYGEEWEKKTLTDWKNTFRAYMDYTKFIIHMGGVTGNEYGIPSTAPNNPAKNAITFGIEEALANLLGIRGLSMAMRRNAELIDEFVAEWDRQNIDPLAERIKAGRGPDERYCFDASIMMLAQNILNPKQFERWYWPSLKKLLDAYAEKKMQVRIFAEGSILKYSDYFKDYPKGTLTFHLEKDDPFEFRRALPNAAIMGGITTDLLSGGTPSECVDYERKLIGELSGDGGFILSENKMLSYKNDARSENLKAVTVFAAEGRY